LPGNKLLIGGFYTKDLATRNVEGVLIKQIDINDGTVVTGKYVSLPDEQKNILSDNSYVIKCLDATPDKKNIIVVAESYSERLMSRSETRPSGALHEVIRHRCFLW
jgi:hypothetical protein